MRYKFSKRSHDNLVGVHPKLVDIVNDIMALQFMDFTVAEGLRSDERQAELVKNGFSKTLFSKHLKQPDGYGHAVDLYPYPIDMKAVQTGRAQEIVRFGFLAGMMLTMAKNHGVKVIWGADWDFDGETLDHTFFDGPHFQIEI